MQFGVGSGQTARTFLSIHQRYSQKVGPGRAGMVARHCPASPADPRFPDKCGQILTGYSGSSLGVLRQANLPLIEQRRRAPGPARRAVAVVT